MDRLSGWYWRRSVWDLGVDKVQWKRANEEQAMTTLVYNDIYFSMFPFIFTKQNTGLSDKRNGQAVSGPARAAVGRW
jgi:hypothetical protein